MLDQSDGTYTNRGRPVSTALVQAWLDIEEVEHDESGENSLPIYLR